MIRNVLGLIAAMLMIGAASAAPASDPSYLGNWARADGKTHIRVEPCGKSPAFRRLCPEQLLRPGDNAEIGWIAIMFTDLKGSTELYDALGDAAAYSLVRDHFAFLSDRVQRNHGFVVKTVGDAVMAAFSRPDDPVRAALAIQDDVASFNSARGRGMSATPIVLKLGLHADHASQSPPATCSITSVPP